MDELKEPQTPFAVLKNVKSRCWLLEWFPFLIQPMQWFWNMGKLTDKPSVMGMEPFKDLQTCEF